MVNVNFVPDDYVQDGESRRTNLMYIVLLLIVMGAWSCCFISIKIQQRTYAEQERVLNEQMAEQKEKIRQIEQLHAKRNAMWKTALTTADLIEPVSRSVLLASLTNNLPKGASLLSVSILQKAPRAGKRSKQPAKAPKATSKYDATKGSSLAIGRLSVSPERQLETHISIEGLSPSDLELASYIERLGDSMLLSKVALIESKEYKARDDDRGFRKFKLTAMVKPSIKVDREIVENVRSKANKI